MLYQLLSILAFCSIFTAAFGLGRPILRVLNIGEEDRLSNGVCSVAVGLIAAGLMLLALGLLGALYVPVIGVLTAVGCFWGFVEIIRCCTPAVGKAEFVSEDGLEGISDEPSKTPWAPPADWLMYGVLLAAGAACFGTLITALAPPTAGDALCCHLDLSKVFLAEHRIGNLPYHNRDASVLLTEMWYLWALALDGGVCAQLVHWGFGVLLALATVVLAGAIVGHHWGLIAGCLVVLVPGVNNLQAATMNHLALATMTTLAIAAWWRAAVGGLDRRWFVVAGLAAGGALAVKPAAILFVAALGATWLWTLARDTRHRGFLLAGAAVATLVAVCVCMPWYAEAVWHGGNTMFSLPSDVFAVTGASDVVYQLGALLIAAVPGVLLCRRLHGLGTLTTTAAGYFVLWLLLYRDVRLLLPAVPLLAVVTAWVWIELRRFNPMPRLIVSASFAAVIIAMAILPLGRCRDRAAVAVGLEDRGEYLSRHEPTWPATAVADAVLPKGAHILSQDDHTFYFNRRVTHEDAYRRSVHYDRGVTGPAELSRRLRDAGFTHLLLAETVAGAAARYDPTLSRLAEAAPGNNSDNHLLTLTEYRFCNVEGVVRRYRLVMLR